MGTSDMLPAEAAALASLLQELQWLQQDTGQQDADLAAAAQQLICELAAAVPGSAGASAGMLDGALGRRTSNTAAGTGTAAATAAAVTGAGVAYSNASLPVATVTAPAELHALADTGMHAGYEDSDLQLLLTQHPLALSTLQQQLLESYAELLRQHRQQLQDTSAQQRLHAGQCRSWTPDQHALFTFFRAQALQGLTRIDAAPHAAAAAASSAAGCGMSGGRSRGAAGCRSHVGSKGSSSSRGAQGCSKASVVDFVAVRMPGKTKQQLAEHEKWCARSWRQRRGVRGGDRVERIDLLLVP